MKKVVVPICILVFLLNFAVAADVAYVYDNSRAIDKNVLDVFSNKSLSVALVQCKNVSGFNFNNSIIFVGNEYLSCANIIPITKHPSLIMNGRHIRDFGLAKTWEVSKIASSSPLKIWKDGAIQIYDRAKYGRESLPIYYTDYNYENVASAYIGREIGSVIFNINAGSVLKNGKTANEKISFFGITETKFWTQETKNLFKQRIDFLIPAEEPALPIEPPTEPPVNETQNQTETNITLIHDVGIDKNYTNSVNGIRIQDLENDSYLLDAFSELRCSKKYTISYKTINYGNFSENITFNGGISDFNWTKNRDDLLEPQGDTTADSKTINISFAPGNYTIEIFANIENDANPDDNHVARNVKVICNNETEIPEPPINETQNQTQTNETLIHDIALSDLKFQNTSGSLIGSFVFANGTEYKILIDVENLGNFTENVTFNGTISNSGNIIQTFSHVAVVDLLPGEKKNNKSRIVKFDFGPGNYVVRVEGIIAIDDAPANNVVSQEINVVL